MGPPWHWKISLFPLSTGRNGALLNGGLTIKFITTVSRGGRRGSGFLRISLQVIYVPTRKKTVSLSRTSQFEGIFINLKDKWNKWKSILGYYNGERSVENGKSRGCGDFRWTGSVGCPEYPMKWNGWEEKRGGYDYGPKSGDFRYFFNFHSSP